MKFTLLLLMNIIYTVKSNFWDNFFSNNEAEYKVIPSRNELVKFYILDNNNDTLNITNSTSHNYEKFFSKPELINLYKEYIASGNIGERDEIKEKINIMLNNISESLNEEEKYYTENLEYKDYFWDYNQMYIDQNTFMKFFYSTAGNIAKVEIFNKLRELFNKKDVNEKMNDVNDLINNYNLDLNNSSKITVGAGIDLFNHKIISYLKNETHIDNSAYNNEVKCINFDKELNSYNKLHTQLKLIVDSFNIFTHYETIDETTFKLTFKNPGITLYNKNKNNNNNKKDDESFLFDLFNIPISGKSEDDSNFLFDFDKLDFSLIFKKGNLENSSFYQCYRASISYFGEVIYNFGFSCKPLSHLEIYEIKEIFIKCKENGLKIDSNLNNSFLQNSFSFRDIFNFLKSFLKDL